MSCPDACWEYKEEEDEMHWIANFCKGCQICINECPTGALTAAPELDFPDGVARLEKPF
jgi:Pyruvate/2-oxoacid:ferredoxin oxidoreductase delta subunit